MLGTTAMNENSRMAIDSDGLHEIANTEVPDRALDIVFVHGLGGASHSTWRYDPHGSENHFFWPQALGQDLEDCGIWTVGYPAGITALGKPGMIIEKRAGNLAQKLVNAGIGARPIVFITHSMGGLIVKSLLVASQTLADDNRKLVASAVRGIVFCGTPHRGSAFADAARVLATLLGGPQPHVDEMRSNAEHLDLLHDEFIEWHRRNPVAIESYAENIGLFQTRAILRPLPLGLVVPRASANPGIPGHAVRDVDDDHLTMVKPRNRQHDVYAGVLRFVKLIKNFGDSKNHLGQERADAQVQGQSIVTTHQSASGDAGKQQTRIAADSWPSVARPEYYCYISRTKVDEMLAQSLGATGADFSSDPDPELPTDIPYGRSDLYHLNAREKRITARRLQKLLPLLRSDISTFNWGEALASQGLHHVAHEFIVSDIDDQHLVASLSAKKNECALVLYCSLANFSHVNMSNGRPSFQSTNFEFFVRRVPVMLDSVFVLTSQHGCMFHGSPIYLKLAASKGLSL